MNCPGKIAIDVGPVELTLPGPPKQKDFDEVKRELQGEAAGKIEDICNRHSCGESEDPKFILCCVDIVDAFYSSRHPTESQLLIWS